MISRLRLYARAVTGSLWFRPAAYALLALVALAATPLVEPFLPFEWKELVSSSTNEAVLTILASSLLAVAIFSLSAMVAALRAASDSATPRARPLLVGDAAAQNAISTFIGAFLFSLLGVIGTLLEIFSATGRVLLFVLTLILVLVVVITLIRWLQRLSNMGDVMEAVRRVEQAANAAFRAAAPPRTDAVNTALQFPDGAALHADTPGFVQSIAYEDLEALCEQQGVRLRIVARVGEFADADTPLARLDGAVSDSEAAALRRTFLVGDMRVFDSDPRLGLVVLSEIASKALSPGVNDPGTAVAAVRAAQRVLHAWFERADDAAPERERRVFTPALTPEEALSCAFAPVAFDGANRPEIAVTLLQALAGLKAVDPHRYAPAVDAAAAALLTRLEGAMTHGPDREAVAREARRLGFRPPT